MTSENLYRCHRCLDELWHEIGTETVRPCTCNPCHDQWAKGAYDPPPRRRVTAPGDDPTTALAQARNTLHPDQPAARQEPA